MKAGRYLLVGALAALLGAGVAFALTPDTAQAQTYTCTDDIRKKDPASCAELDKLQEEIDQYTKVLQETTAKKNTIQGDVTALTAQINKAQAEINQRTKVIGNLGGEIRQKNARIGTLEERLSRGKQSLAKLLREKNQADEQSLAIVALTSQDLSDFYSNVDAIDTIDRELHDLFAELRGVKEETEKEKQALAAKQDQELNARQEVEVKKQQINENKKEKDVLLSVAKQDEAAYSQVLADRKAKAAAIYARLFPLRDTAAIKFGDAVAFAQVAGQKTGVRPALILAILSQESSLGANVGNCLVTDLETGNGKGKNTGTPIAGVMKAPRDTVPFKRITDALGKDWSTTPVSCPQSAGYGGAMGPTQFIPSTWELFEPRIKSALGVSATNPWNAGHAIMATGLYLMDSGAGPQTYTAERNAACRYFSGRACPGSGWIDGYANSVVAKANAFQKDIEALKDL